jgi:hypothetical protein
VSSVGERTCKGYQGKGRALLNSAGAHFIDKAIDVDIIARKLTREIVKRGNWLLVSKTQLSALRLLSYQLQPTLQDGSEIYRKLNKLNILSVLRLCNVN